MFRQFSIPLEELALDCRSVSERINRVLSRNSLRIAGGGKAGNRLLVFCESARGGDWCRIAPFEGFSEEEILSEVRRRFDASFATAAVWEASGRMWGIFVREAVR